MDAPPSFRAIRPDHLPPTMPARAVVPLACAAFRNPPDHSCREIPKAANSAATASISETSATDQSGMPAADANVPTSFSKMLPVTPPMPILTGQASGVPTAASPTADKSKATGTAVTRTRTAHIVVTGDTPAPYHQDQPG